MPETTYHAWLALYTGVGVLVILCASASVFKTLYDLRAGTLILNLENWKGRTTALPKLWWRWQVNYLTGAPVILTIALMFAHHLGFATLVDV